MWNDYLLMEAASYLLSQIYLWKFDFQCIFLQTVIECIYICIKEIFNYVRFIIWSGIPNFIRKPPSTYDVTEQSNLQLRIEMDGNPKPSAEFDWAYLPVSSPRNVPATPLYPFVYSSTYSLSNIDGSYCGRILQTTLKNSIGSSSVGETNVTVICKFHYGYLCYIYSDNLWVMIFAQFTTIHPPICSFWIWKSSKLKLLAFVHMVNCSCPGEQFIIQF